jgi:hypothetical protein
VPTGARLKGDALKLEVYQAINIQAYNTGLHFFILPLYQIITLQISYVTS